MTTVRADLEVNTTAAEQAAAALGISFQNVLDEFRDRWHAEVAEMRAAVQAVREQGPSGTIWDRPEFSHLVSTEDGWVQALTASGFSASGPSIDIEFPAQNQPPTVSLLSSCRDVTSVLQAAYGDHWLNGIEFEPEKAALVTTPSGDFPYFWQCPEAGGFRFVDGPSFGATGTKVIPSRPTSPVKWRPYVAHTADPCISVMGFAGRDYQGRAKRLLASNLSRIVANEFWTGLRVTQQAQFPNAYLTQSPTAVNGLSTKVGYMDALADLESGYHDRANTPGCLHMPIRTAAVLRAERLIFPGPTGRSLQTIFGNTVVTDAGYDGSGPSGGTVPDRKTQWMYATGPTMVAANDIRYVPTPPGTEDAQGAQGGWVEALDFASSPSQIQNVHWRAECDTFAFWDEQVNVGVLTDLTTESS